MAEKTCIFECKEAKICQKCKPVLRGEFKKALELKSSGLSIYVHNNGDQEKKMTHRADPVVIYNHGPREANKSNYVEEIKNYGSKCKRCSSILTQIRDLLEEIQEIKKDDVTGICEYCKASGAPSQCKRCSYLVNKFLIGKVKQYEKRHERFKDWFIKVKYLLTVLLQKGSSKTLDDSQELKRLLQELQRLRPEREIDITTFPGPEALTKEKQEALEALAQQTDQLDKVLTEFERELKARQPLDRSLFVRDVPDKVLANLGKLTKEKLEKLLGPELTRNMIDQILANLGSLTKDKAEMLLGAELTQEILNAMLTNLVKGLPEDEAKRRLAAMMKSDEQQMPKQSAFKQKGKPAIGDQEKDQDNLQKRLVFGEAGVKPPPKGKQEKDSEFIPDFIKKDDKYEPIQKVKPRTGEDKLALLSKKEETPPRDTLEGMAKTLKDKKKSKATSLATSVKESKKGDTISQETPVKGSEAEKLLKKRVSAKSKEAKPPSAKKSMETLKKSESGRMIKKPTSKQLMSSPSGRIKVGPPSQGRLLMQGIIKSQAQMASRTQQSTGKIVVGPLETQDSKFDIRDTVPMDEVKKFKTKNKTRLFQIVTQEPEKDESESEEGEDYKRKKRKGKKGKGKVMQVKAKEKYEESIESEEEQLDEIQPKRKPMKLTESRKHLLGLMKKREKERQAAQKAKLKAQKELDRIVVADFKELPALPKAKKSQTIEVGGIEICQTGPELPTEMIDGLNIIKYQRQHVENIGSIKPLFFSTRPICPPSVVKEAPQEEYIQKQTMSTIFKSMGDKEIKGIIRYELSNPEYIDKGWTQLPTVKIMRRLHVYKMIPANPENDWFNRHKNDRVIFYDTGEKLAEIDPDGHGRWYYKNGVLALDFYKAEEPNAENRYVVYSTGEREESTGRRRPVTMLASFDHLGSGIVYDHFGNERLKYNQSEGMVLDESIGAPGRWKWHGLNDPPDVTSTYMENVIHGLIFPDDDHQQPSPAKKRSSKVDELSSKRELTSQQMRREESKVKQVANEEMLAIEYNNFVKEKSHKLLQKFKQFEILPKFCRINDYFSLKIMNQKNICLQYRCGQTILKLNLGLILIDSEIVDSENVEVATVATPFDRFLVRSKSVENLKELIKMTRVKTHVKSLY